MPNPDLYLIGTADFSLITGATEAPAQESDYDQASAMFGNIDSVGVQNSSETREHFGSYQGVKVLDDVHVTQLRLGYTLTCHEVDDRMIETMFYGQAGAPTTGDPVYSQITPIAGSQTLKGFGRLRVFDGKSPANPRLIHKDFLCRVNLSSQPDLNDENYFSFELKVDILHIVGTVLRRRDS